MLDKSLKANILKYADGILILFHLIGLAIFCYPNRPENLSGFNMLLCSVLVFWSAQEERVEFRLLGTIALLGWLVEVVGVNTGWLFGDYEYGSELGFKIWGVPLVLGLNWYCVVAASTQVVRKHFKINLLAQAFLAGLLCTALDFVIEPVAIKYHFWTWIGGEIPLFNYLCWFVFSSIFAYFYLLNTKDLGFNKTAYSLFFIWLVFFTVLNFI